MNMREYTGAVLEWLRTMHIGEFYIVDILKIDQNIQGARIFIKKQIEVILIFPVFKRIYILDKNFCMEIQPQKRT